MLPPAEIREIPQYSVFKTLSEARSRLYDCSWTSFFQLLPRPSIFILQHLTIFQNVQRFERRSPAEEVPAVVEEVSTVVARVEALAADAPTPPTPVPLGLQDRPDVVYR